ncbi:caspase family protein [Aquimarina sp. Aq78]|uniref:caspase family protein n=1 Tax=Aquimarina sp. Aq78 TaxID=1191889 RepID=UPI00131E3B17|nr:caspase family protein [Aquimarina sp. Aq78]
MLNFLLLLLIVLFSSCNSCEKEQKNEHKLEKGKEKGKALLIGMRKTNISKYSNTATFRSRSNIKRIKKILEKEDFSKIEILESPKDTEFLNSLKMMINELNNDELLVIYYFGHGGQIEDDIGGYDNEYDGLDETFVTKNREVRDDEIYKILNEASSNGKILFIIDACNSESLIKFTQVIQHDIAIELDSSLDVLYLGATNDGKEIPPNTFSKLLEKVWDNGKFDGNYLDFHNELINESRNIRGMNPILDDEWASEGFIKRQPFKIY